MWSQQWPAIIHSFSRLTTAVHRSLSLTFQTYRQLQYNSEYIYVEVNMNHLLEDTAVTAHSNTRSAHLCLFPLHHSHAGVGGPQIDANDSASDRLGPETAPAPSAPPTLSPMSSTEPQILTHNSAWLQSAGSAQSVHANQPEKHTQHHIKPSHENNR